MAIALAAQGKRVVVLDVDLGLANVEVLLGLNSLYNLQHVIDGERTLKQVMVQGPGGIDLIPGSSGIAQIADLGSTARKRIIDGLDELQREVDFIILDTMAGIGQNTVSFCSAADEVLLVTTPEPSAIVDAYAMVKTMSQVAPDAPVRLIVNMTASDQQARAVANKLNRVAQQYLGRQMPCCGYVLRDPHVSQAVMQSTPFIQRFPNAPASRCITALASRVIQQEVIDSAQRGSFLKRFAQAVGIAS